MKIDIHCTKDRSFYRVNKIDTLMSSSPPFRPTIKTSFKICRRDSKAFYPYTDDDVCSLASSVDSCGGDTSSHINREALSSDADSSRSNSRVPHRTELKSYRRILEEFYGHGPLSWEQQEYLADLRSMLHVSNDEHLREKS